MTNKNNVVELKKALDQAEGKAKKRDLEGSLEANEQIEQKKLSLLQELNSLTGEDWGLHKYKDPYAKEPFSQIMHRNLDLLVQINYLTQAEESFLLRIQPYLEFKTNVIVCREDKFKKQKKREEEGVLPKSATVSDIAEMIGKSRKATSLLMNGLKEKQILLSPEGAGTVVVNGRNVTPRTWILNPYIAICAPRTNGVQLDKLTMRLFQHSLKNLTDQNGKKVKLPVRFF